jgi:hypothetical protein
VRPGGGRRCRAERLALLAVGLALLAVRLDASCCYQPKRDSWPSLSAEIRLPAVAATFSWKICTCTACFSSIRKKISKIITASTADLAVISDDPSGIRHGSRTRGCEPAASCCYHGAPGALVGHKAGMAARHAVPVAHRIPSNDPTRPKTMMTRRQSLARRVDQRVLMPVVPVATRCWFPVVRPGAAFSCWRQITRMRPVP